MGNIPDDQIEIIDDFMQESRDMLDNLEPTIIELGQSCQAVACWEALSCTQQGCPRHGHAENYPCWLDQGYVGDGAQTCIFAANETECRDCSVFELTNGDGETMNAIFRLFHSMKGSAGFLEFNHIMHVSHMAENLLDLVRSGKIQLEAEHVDLLCEGCDFARAALDYVGEHYVDDGMEEAAVEIAARLEGAIEDAKHRMEIGPSRPSSVVTDATVAEDLDPESDKDEPEKEETETALVEALQDLITPEMQAKFVEEADELLTQSEQGLLAWGEAGDGFDGFDELFRNIHSFKGNCGFFGYSDLEKLSHQMETVLDAARNKMNFGDDGPQDLLLEMLDLLRGAVIEVSTNAGPGQIANLAGHVEKLQGLLSQVAEAAPDPQSAATPDVVPDPVPTVAPPTPEPAKTPAPAAKAPTAAKAATKAVPAKSPQKSAGNPKTTVKRQDIRVDLDKLDKLINLIGEMVIAENMLVNNPDLLGLELENFGKASQQMSKIVRELQEMAMVIRMIPVSGLFRRMIRLVHDISHKAGKKVELVLEGEETEVDKTVIEQITDPLVHLLRNSLDHGLEPPEERVANEKSEKGVLRLTARHEEGEVWITVTDDGRGLNREKILAKAVEKGLINGDGSDLSDRQVFGMIFQAGFSTADQVTDISGRGVGMDVVRQNLEKIKGKIEVSSKPGQGTTMKLRIPLTLAIIDGLMIRIGKTSCIVPLLAVREIFRPTSDAITHTPDGQELVKVRENFIPVLRLHNVLQKEPDSYRLEEGTLVVLENQDDRIGLFVDEILGQQQTVIKGLSSYLGNVQYASGCTILGDGDVCLILDVGSLVEASEQGAQNAPLPGVEKESSAA